MHKDLRLASRCKLLRPLPSSVVLVDLIRALSADPEFINDGSSTTFLYWASPLQRSFSNQTVSFAHGMSSRLYQILHHFYGFVPPIPTSSKCSSPCCPQDRVSSGAGLSGHRPPLTRRIQLASAQSFRGLRKRFHYDSTPPSIPCPPATVNHMLYRAPAKIRHANSCGGGQRRKSLDNNGSSNLCQR